MKRMITLVAVCLLLASAVWAQADTASLARQTAEQMMRGAYGQVVARFDETMRGAVDEAALAAGFGQIMEALGACTEVIDVQADEDARTAVVRLAHERGASRMMAAFDAQDRIASLFIAPEQESAQAVARALPEGASAQAVELFAGSARALAGEMIVPAGEALAYVVFAHGSGPSDMNETIGGNQPFRDLAYDLAALGVGSLRFDKITYAHPEIPVQTVEQEYLEPVREALRVLREHAGAARVYVIGHSEGGMLTPYLTEEGGFDGGISLAGTPLALWEISMAQNLAVMELVPEAQRAPLLAQIDAEREKGLRLAQMSDEEAAAETVFGISAVYLRHMARMDQAEIARRCGKPFLFLWGEADFQVGREAFAAWQARLGSDARYTYRTYPGLNHLLMTEDEGDSILNAAAAYETPKTVAPQVAADIAAWIAERQAE